MKDYTVDIGPLARMANDFIHANKSDWTERQRDLHLTTVGGFLLLAEAFSCHHKAIKDRDWSKVEYTLEQLHHYTFSVFDEAVKHIQEATPISTKMSQAGRASAQARTRDPEQMRARYHALMKRYDNNRPKVVQQLARDFDLQADSVRKQLRKLGLGRPQKIKD